MPIFDVNDKMLCVTLNEEGNITNINFTFFT